jgi:glycosyltransferase involved in cell wall biosynthesis
MDRILKWRRLHFMTKKNISRKIIESKEKSIVFGSRFLARKNPVLFAEIMDKILNEYPEWNGYVLGGGELEQEVRSILKVHIESGLVYVGRVAEFLGVLKKSSIYVSIIQPDNYPSQSVLEAMNTYNLLLISDTGNSDKFIDQENYHGELVELNFNSIYSGLVRLINKHECVECRLHSFDHLNNTFSPDIYFSHLHEIYK